MQENASLKTSLFLRIHQRNHVKDHAPGLITLELLHEAIFDGTVKAGTPIMANQLIEYAHTPHNGFARQTTQHIARRGLDQLVQAGFFTTEILSARGRGRAPTLYIPLPFDRALNTLLQHFLLRK